MDPIAAFAAEIHNRINSARTTTSRGVCVATSGGEVSFTIGGDPTPRKGRWVGVTAPQPGEVITYLDDGSGYPLVFGPTGREALVSLYEWTNYTVAWTGTSGHPILGNGSLTGRYAVASQWVMVEIHMKAGSTTNFGIGAHAFSLPATASNNGDAFPLDGYLYDYSTARFYRLQGIIPSGQTVVYPMYQYILDLSLGGAIGNNYLDASQPVTLADADAIHLTGIYRYG